MTTRRAVTSAICSICEGEGRNQIDDALAEAQGRGQFHCPGEPDAFGLHAARGEMAPGDFRIFRGDADMAPARGVVVARELGRLRHRQAAAADLQVDGGIDLGIVEFHQHVAADDAQCRCTEGYERRHIEAAHSDDLDVAPVGAKAQLPVGRIAKCLLRPDAGAGQ